MTHSTDPIALFCALFSAICALGYLLGAFSHRIAMLQSHALVEEAGDALDFRSVMVFQAVGAMLFAAASLLISLCGIAFGNPLF
ncbi:MAG: hypothetical protein JWO25_676 [Alphaproteobacteria bacterium]|nr:hypothetical protein [Alphaproteobacteria bacterium]